jgi:hypothetical protein
VVAEEAAGPVALAVPPVAAQAALPLQLLQGQLRHLPKLEQLAAPPLE